jgi:predicted kinase
MACIYTYKGKQYSEQEIKDIVFKEKVKPEDIKFATLNDIANILAYSNSKIILDGWKVEYSTPLGNKYDTLEEVNNEIRGLSDTDTEVDLSGVKLPIDNDVKKVEDIPIDEFRGVDGRTFKKIDNKWYDARIKIDWKDDTKQEVVEIPTNILQTNSEILYQYNSRNGSFDGNDFVRNDFKGFIEKNKEYEQSKEIIEEWKKESNIQYDPEEVYSRGQGFYSSIGAYSNLELDLLLKNLIQHIQDNKKASQPNVILPIGTSGSGKSTFIKSLPQENLVIIEPDAMRVEFTGDMNNKSKDKEIYIEAAQRAIKAIKQGKQVVFDTTNLTKDKRLPFIEAIKKEIPNANIQYKLMELNPELAKQRIKADIAAGKNRANVPDSTIDRHAESYKQMLEDIKNEPITPYGSNYGFTISAFTKPIDKRLKHIEGTGDRVRFVIYPKSEHIKWAAPTDVFSGSVWDANTKVSTDKKSELLGVSYTKSPSLNNVNKISPNLSEIIDSLEHTHNELAIELTEDNFEIEYDENIDYSTKQIINSVNKILQQKRLQEIDNFINTLEKECK